MRILEICLSDYLGGLELYFIKCARQLTDNGINVSIAYRKDSRIASEVACDNLPKVQIGKWNKYFPLPQAFNISRFIRKHKIDVIHVHHSWDLLLCALIKLLSGKGVRLVYTRQMEIPFSKHDLYHKWLYHQIDLMLVITKKLVRDTRQFVPIPEERVSLIYHGTAPSHDNPDCQQFEKWKNHLKIGVISRIQHSKGQHQIVEAVRNLREEGKQVVAFFYGDVMVKEDMEKIQNMIDKWDLHQNIFFKGFHKNPRSIMSCFDLIIQPSKLETFGLTLIEAMREGVAVMGTNSGGIPEIIDDHETGRLFHFEDIDELTEILSELYAHPEKLQELAAAGKEKADNEFDEKRHFNSLEEHFRELVNG